MKNPIIISALICEDIRQEASGKFSLAGVLSSALDIAALPGNAMLGLYAEVRFPELGPVESQFRIVDSSDNELIKGTLKLNVPNFDAAPMVLGPFQPQDRQGRPYPVAVESRRRGLDDRQVAHHPPQSPPPSRRSGQSRLKVRENSAIRPSARYAFLRDCPG